MMVELQERPQTEQSRDERLFNLEDAVRAYFAGEYPVGTVRTELDAERVLTEAASRAAVRNA